MDSAGDVGAWPAIAIDSAGTVYVSYYDATSTALRFAVGR